MKPQKRTMNMLNAGVQDSKKRVLNVDDLGSASVFVLENWSPSNINLSKNL